MAGKSHYTIEQVRQLFSDHGCRLLTSSYKNNKTKLTYICSCNNINETTLNTWLRRGKKCNSCAGNQKYTFTAAKKIFEDNGLILLEQTYKNNKAKMLCICSCGRKTKIALWRVKARQKCYECYISSKSERYNDPEYIQWRTQVFKRDNYKCRKCGSTYRLNAHHLFNYMQDEQNRFNLDNGRTLCRNCHLTFHKRFGFSDNSFAQYYKYFDGDAILFDYGTKFSLKKLRLPKQDDTKLIVSYLLGYDL